MNSTASSLRGLHPRGSVPFLIELHRTRQKAFSTLVLRRRGLGHVRRRRGREMRAPILDQPLIAVADRHEEKVDRYHGYDRPIWTVDIAQGKECVGARDIGVDEEDPIIRRRR